MSDRSNLPDPDRDGRLRDRLTVLGDQIRVTPSDDHLIGVEQAARRRLRRRRAAAGLVGVGAILVGGAVLVTLNDDDGPDSVAVTADEPTDEPTDDQSQGEGGADDHAPGDTSDDASGEDRAAPQDAAPTPPEPAAPEDEVTVVAAQRTTAETELAPGEFVDATVHTWQDGFLRLETEWPGQPLPTEFPDEITALFSDEVVTLIEEQQPATIEEAMELLTDAGLLDEVAAVLGDHPDASEVIRATPPPSPVVTAGFSVDGLDWEPVEFTWPTVGEVTEQIHSDGDRLVVFGYDFGSEDVGAAGPFSGPPPLEFLRIAVTEDLRTWDEIEVPVPVTATDLPEFIVQGSFPVGFAVNDTDWAIALETSNEVDIDALFGDRLPVDDPAFEGGYGTDVTDEGVALQRFDEDGFLVEILVTWDELGVDPIAPEEISRTGPSRVITGTFDGVVRQPVDLAGFGTIVGIPEGFVRVGEPSVLSTDGLTWTEVAAPDGSPAPGGVTIRHGDDLVVYGLTGPDEPTAAFVLDPNDPAWRPATAPALPPGSYDAFGRGGGSNGVTLYSVDPPFVPEPFETTASIEVDGYIFTQTMTHLGQSYSLVGPDGTEIVAESFDDADMGDDAGPTGPFDHLRFEPPGVVILDPVTGEVVVEITESQLNRLWQALTPATDVDEPEPVTMPETRVLATDGARWIDEVLTEKQQMPDGDVGPAWPRGAAVNDGVVVVTMSDGSVERFEF